MVDNKDGSDAPAVLQSNGTRVPKKRFVGRKTAEAQAQRTGGDVEQSHTTAIQTGMRAIWKTDYATAVYNI